MKRIEVLDAIFEALQSTASLNDKRAIIEIIPNLYKEDFEYVLEVLAGKHVFGYTYDPTIPYEPNTILETMTVKEVLQFLQEPRANKDLSQENIRRHVSLTTKYAWFFEPIVNRTLRLGIAQSVLSKEKHAPMLARDFATVSSLPRSEEYFVTQKLDGNRCIAFHDGVSWNFVSRNGKPMKVNFNMAGMNEDYIYDGEILSRRQTEHIDYVHGFRPDGNFTNEFSSTSGLINSHSKSKDLVYNIFDIMLDDTPYKERRWKLDRMIIVSPDIRILPILAVLEENVNEVIWDLLDKVTAMNAEGLMINAGDALYQHKRTNQLLKLKKVQTIDMRVVDFERGTGKYTNAIGALYASVETDAGQKIECKVGTGLSDEERTEWYLLPDRIIGKTIEVAYFEMSQSQAQKGTNYYSLRFPRFKGIRTDKEV